MLDTGTNLLVTWCASQKLHNLFLLSTSTVTTFCKYLYLLVKMPATYCEGFEFFLKNSGKRYDMLYCASRNKTKCQVFLRQYETNVEVHGNHNDECIASQAKIYPSGKKIAEITTYYIILQSPTN